MKKLKLGELLLTEGKIDEAQLKTALGHQRKWGKKLGDCLVELGFISEIQMVHTLARSLRLPLIDLTRLDSSKITREILNYIDLPIARKNRVVPLAIKEIKRKKRLVIATADPTNFEVFDEVQFKAGLPLLVMLAPNSDIDWFLRKYYMNQGEALPENYISGISLIQDLNGAEKFDDPDHLPTTSVQEVFQDEEFISQSKVGKPKKSES